MNEAAQILDKTTSIPQGQEAALPLETTKQEDPKVSSKLEALIRREQTALARENAAKDREKSLEEKLRRIEEFESVKTNPKKGLELLGLSYDEMTQAHLADGQVTPDLKLKQMEEKFNKYVDSQNLAEQTKAEDAKKKAEAEEMQATNNFKTQIETYLKDNSNKYELIAFEGCQELVYEVIDEHYSRTKDKESGVGKVLSLQEAADKVEEYLVTKYEKSKSINKIKQLWNTMPKKLVQEATKPQFTMKPKTITNNLNSTQTKPRNTPLSDDERVRRAIEYAKSLRPGGLV